MEKMSISEFKVHCMSVLERIRRSRTRILITRYGQPVAEVAPPSVSSNHKRKLGALAGTATITGDIVGPVVPEEEWDALR